MAAALALALAGCGGDDRKDDPPRPTGDVTLGYVTLASAAAPMFVAANRNFLILAADQINAQGGLLGGKLVLDVQETDLEEGSTGRILDGFKARGLDKVVLGFFSGVGKEIGPRAVLDRFLYLGVASSSTVRSVPDPDNLLWWLSPDVRVWGVAHADYLEQKGFRRLAIISGEDVVNMDVARVLAESWTARQREVVDQIVYQEPEGGAFDTSSILARAFDPMMAADAIMLYPLSDTEAAQLVRDAVATGKDQKRFVLDENSASDYFIETVTAANAEGIGGAQPVLAESASLTSVRAAYMQKFNAAPQYETDTVNAYDQVYVAAMAIEKAGKVDAAAVRDALPRLFDPSGTPVRAGEWQKARMLIASGAAINYESASGWQVDLPSGENRTNVFDEFTITGGQVRFQGKLRRCTYTPGAGSSCQAVSAR